MTVNKLWNAMTPKKPRSYMLHGPKTSRSKEKPPVVKADHPILTMRVKRG